MKSSFLLKKKSFTFLAWIDYKRILSLQREILIINLKLLIARVKSMKEYSR